MDCKYRKRRTVTILGDSYSTFAGYNHKGYDMWYPNEQQGVTDVNQTWWKKLCDEENLELIENNSYSGSTVCNTGYDGMDSSFSSYVTRFTKEMSKEAIASDYLLIFGATNDFWSGAPIGTIKYSDFTDADLKQFAPAFCYMIDYAAKRYTDSKIYVVENDILPDYIVNIMDEVCEHFGVETIKLDGVNMIYGHPTVAGMETIKNQVATAINKDRKIINVLCYGDSNTYGHIPIACTRYDRNTRWTGVLQSKLGKSFIVIEEGCNGRTTVFDDPDEPWKNGLASLRPCLNTHKPIDVVIVMLGSNDLKTVFHASPEKIADGMERIICDIREFTEYKQGFIPEIILMCPPPIGEGICESQFNTCFDLTAVERSKQLAPLYKKISQKYGCTYVNTADYIESSKEDSLHLSKEAHRVLAEVLTNIILDVIDI